MAVAEQQKAFVSLSIDTDKLGQYLADELFPDQSAYLIVDASNRVILDTTHRLVGESLVLPTANQLVSSMNGKIGDENVRIAWTDVGEFGWQFVQLIPLSEFEATMRFEQNTINLVLLFSVLLSMLLSYLTTKKLFRPVEAILSILENPSNQQITDANGEINMLLTRILDLEDRLRKTAGGFLVAREQPVENALRRLGAHAGHPLELLLGMPDCGGLLHDD